MNQFTVPQFIDVEDKIIGPITTRQFIICLSGFVLMAIFYKIFDFSLFVATALLIFAIFGTFAFAKINGRPFHYFILNVVQTAKKPRLRIWHHIIGKIGEEDIVEVAHAKPIVKPEEKHLSTSRLAEVSLIVDTQGSYKGEGKNYQAQIKQKENEKIKEIIQ